MAGPLTWLRRAARGDADEMARGVAWPRIMKLRLIILGSIAVFAAISMELADEDMVTSLSASRRFQFWYLTALGCVIAANLWGLRRVRSERAYRAYTVFSQAGECCALAAGFWITGAHGLAYTSVWAVIYIAIYRLTMGPRLGLAAFAVVVVAHGAIGALDLLGVTETGYIVGLLVRPEASQPGVVARLLVVHFMIYGATWLAASTVARRNAELWLARRRIRRLVGSESGGRLAGAVLADEYEIVTLVGVGGMGEVYRARRRKDGREIAIKLLHLSLSDRPEALTRFRREADAAARVAPGFVPAVHDIGVTEEGQPFFVMELISGESLELLLTRAAPLPQARVGQLVEAIASCLDAIHEAGIVHRDLKPPNILVVDGPGIRSRSWS